MHQVRISKALDKCPKDVDPVDFRKLLDVVPEGFRLIRSYRYKWMRNFVFHVEREAKEIGHLKRGEKIEFACVCKLERL